MYMDLLRQIASSRLPKSFDRLEDVDAVRLLCAAGLVIASTDSADKPGVQISVLAITRKGLDELSKTELPVAASASPSWLKAFLGFKTKREAAARQKHK